MTDIDMDAVIDELRKPGGWKKRSPGDWDEPNGSVCLIGACRRVAGAQDIEEAWRADEVAEVLLFPVIAAQFPDRGAVDIPDFNDHEDTTLEDVIFVCEKARAAQGEVRHD